MSQRRVPRGLSLTGLKGLDTMKTATVIFKCKCGHNFPAAVDVELGTQAGCPACTGEAVCAVRVGGKSRRESFDAILDSMRPRDAGVALLLSAVAAIDLSTK